MELTENDENMEETSENDGNDGGEAEQGEIVEISLHATLGKTTKTTTKLKGKVGSRYVIILIDSGSTHNFISEDIVAEMSIPVQQSDPFGVPIGNGEIIGCNRICPRVEVKLSNLTIVQDFYPLTIGGADLVIGIKWLASLNTVQTNWNGKCYKLQGIRSGITNEGAFQNMTVEPSEDTPPSV